MKVKKYVAPSMPEAMDRIRKELGSQAVILNSRDVFRGGFLGLFKKRHIEVIAALDPQPQPESQHENHHKKEAAAVTKTTDKQTPSKNDPVLNEVKQLRKLVETQTADGADYPPDYQVIYHHLLAQEVDEKLAQNLMENVIRDHETNNGLLEDQERIWQDVSSEIERQLSTLNHGTDLQGQQIIQFVGPTGAGKTTTIAKIASSALMNEQKQVALMTADTYRISAIDQLNTYAQILNIPLEVIYNAEDYQAAVQKLASSDLILVDTAGRNFMEQKHVQDLQQTITFNASTRTCLVLSLTAKAKDMTAIYEQFQHLPISQVVFTKMDETREYGSILNIALPNSLGVAFLTNGQDVPDDIVKPSSRLISDLIAGDRHDR
ncbi:flagellar biosynthesis protein FlhF [Barrientosiimonas marina]|uniref:Flagellar biosynthesis protein FlhF n=1 Tax=Lentibacillus kimchii TaxID=1542911 RepID=A0ABW2UQ38_9BACI